MYYGWYYHHIKKDYNQMKKYYFMAIENGSSSAMNNLGEYYMNTEKDYDQMKKYFRMAIERGHSNAMNNLGEYYMNTEKDYDQMKKYFGMAIERGHLNAMKNLVNYYNDDAKSSNDYSFLENKCIENDELHKLLDKRFKTNFILPKKFYHAFCTLQLQQDSVTQIVQIKQYVLKKCGIFPSNYSNKYLIQFIEVLSIASCPNSYFPKDIMLLIAAYLFI